jgi:hypothetical protein
MNLQNPGHLIMSMTNRKEQSNHSKVTKTRKSQKNLYDETAYPIIECVIEGYNGTRLLL